MTSLFYISFFLSSFLAKEVLHQLAAFLLKDATGN